MQNPKAPPAARVAAASQVINRGYGLPTQTIEQATITKRAEEYTDDELATIIAQAQGVPVKPAAEQPSKLLFEF